MTAVGIVLVGLIIWVAVFVIGALTLGANEHPGLDDELRELLRSEGGGGCVGG